MKSKMKLYLPLILVLALGIKPNAKGQITAIPTRI